MAYAAWVGDRYPSRHVIALQSRLEVLVSTRIKVQKVVRGARARRSIRLRSFAARRYLFVLPAVIFLLIFFAYPVADNVVTSFQDVGIASFVSGNAPFVGFANYSHVLQTLVFQEAARNTALFAVFSIVFQFSIGLVLALFFNRLFPLARTIRALILIPWLLPVVVTATAFKWLFAEPNGVVTYLLGTILHVIPAHTAWLADPQLALPVAIVANIWIGVPFDMVLLHSGLQGISQEIYEAAAIDGAGRWTRFWHVTLPLLRPVIAVLLMLSVVYTVKVFDVVYVLTGGGPADATQLFSILSYQLSFTDFLFGQGAAVGNIMVLIVLVFAVGYLYVLRREQTWS
jgi:multiple sugar transport system permease protein